MTLLAVHISDGVLQWQWLLGGDLLALMLVLLGSRRLSDEEIPRVAVLSAAFFVTSWIHVPIGAGSVHLLLNGLVGIILGPRSALAIALALFLQALLFSHGGVTTLGVNSCVMTLPAIGAWLAFARIKSASWFHHSWGRWTVGLLIGGLTVMATAGLNCLVLKYGGMQLDALTYNGHDSPKSNDYDWSSLAAAVLLVHIPVAVVEALVMAATINFLFKVKPEMLGICSAPPVSSIASVKKEE